MHLRSTAEGLRTSDLPTLLRTDYNTKQHILIPERVEGQRGAMQRVRDAPPLGGDHADRQEDRDQVERGELAGDERRHRLQRALRHRLDDRLREKARVRSVLGAEGEPEAVALSRPPGSILLGLSFPHPGTHPGPSCHAHAGIKFNVHLLAFGQH